MKTRKWHYFQHTKGEDKGKGPCLYDLENDPEERVNVLERYPEVVEEMRKRLEERLGRPLPEI